jgi:FixJ family two-component response regulator
MELRVFAVDDDPLVLRALERILRWHNIPVEGFTSPSSFLQRLPYDGIACLLLDLQMPGLTGLEVQNAISREGMSMPIVFLSAWGDVPSTVRAMREGAIDFLVKPVEEDELLEALERARVKAVALRQRQQLERDAEQRLARLTAREREVCDLIAAGLLNKQIAGKLRLSEKTVKVHRSRVTRKLGVDSVAALVRLLFNRPASPLS